MSSSTVSRWTTFRRKVLPFLVFLIPVATTLAPGWNQWVIDDVMTPLGEHPAVLLWVLGAMVCFWWFREGVWGDRIDHLNSEHDAAVRLLETDHRSEVARIGHANDAELMRRKLAHDGAIADQNVAHRAELARIGGEHQRSLSGLTDQIHTLERELAKPNEDDQYFFDRLAPYVRPGGGALGWLDVGTFTGKMWTDNNVYKVIELIDAAELVTFHDTNVEDARRNMVIALNQFVSDLGQLTGKQEQLFGGGFKHWIKRAESVESEPDRGRLNEQAAKACDARDRFIASGRLAGFSMKNLRQI
ncbi:MAG: hypothetical protein U5O16_20985 [Rhodococcus sp. (in: high G+C Gram-positive bacteria)]|uniref:hypothetical protein n=1 Tax=Rhodococcus sp. TaxID=1831 RepID=UPI002ADBF394|nr:hypothetical protein [Rhodococcus sp. (in: high G+C Gram-positive bacteria)]